MSYRIWLRPQFSALAILSSVLFASAANADGGQKGQSLESENYDKSKELLPGEEVVTPTGQGMKVWSTKGPVQVSRPPEPFKDPEAPKVGDIDVVVDTRGGHVRKPASNSHARDVQPEAESASMENLRKRKEEVQGQVRIAPESPEVSVGRDSFDLRKDK